MWFALVLCANSLILVSLPDLLRGLVAFSAIRVIFT